MPPCPSRGGGRRGGTSFGTSSSSRGDTDSTLRTALLSGLKLFGEKYDFELLAKHDECERLTLRVSNPKGTSFGTSSSSRGDYGTSFGTSSSSRGDYGTSFGTSSSSRGDYGERIYKKFRKEVGKIRAKVGSELENEKVFKVSWERIGEDYSAESLRKLFEKFGEVDDVVIKSSKKRGNAFLSCDGN
ncbi:hypothetical protein LOK49_LG09G00199 [Camellia lanceoleosa]|uniref:Uncharacterized protein n=1 Tax=Camellia lanceoleosa TaxID=1840588 RepID=A0ACC0GGX7_9ERIC|nr:hypothetical protein LOK49_LG09G00199 [Camellia lanceoleosa]